MTRIFPLIAVFAMLATLCLSTTSAIPVAKRDATSTAKCVSGKWDEVRELLSYATEEQKAEAPALFKDGKPIATAPSDEKIDELLDEFEKADPDNYNLFMTVIQCPA